MDRWIRRIAWSVVAQGASSIPNFGLYAAMASTLAPDEFGRFVAIMAVYHLALAVARSAVFEPFVADSSLSSKSSLLTGGSARSVALGFAGAVAVVIVGVVVGSPTWSWSVLAVAMVPLLAQDGLRHLGWTFGHPSFPVALDLVWVGVFVVGLVVGAGPVGLWTERESGTPIAEQFLLSIWAGGGLAGAILGAAAWLYWSRAGAVPGGRLWRSIPTSTDEGDLDDADRSGAVHVMGRSQAIQSTAFNLLPLAIAVAVSPSAASDVKAVLLPFTPILTTVAGTRLVTLPAMRQAVADGREAIDRMAVTVAGVGGVFAVLGGLVVVAALTWLPIGAEGSALEYSRTVAWWGLAITTMSVVDKFLADALALGRRNVAVIPMRLTALAIEWVVLLAVASIGPGVNVAAVWAIGLALGSLVWIAPTVGGRLVRVSVRRSRSFHPGLKLD